MSVAKHSLIYTIAIFLQGLTSFLLLPIYTTYLAPKEYGIIAVVSSMTNLLSVLYTFYLQSAITRFYFDYERSKQKIKQLFGTIFTFVIICGVILTLVFIVLGPSVFELILEGIQFYPYILLGLFIVFFNALYILYLSVLQTKQQSTRFAITNISYVLTQAVLTIIFLAIFHMQASGVLLAIAITNAILVIYIAFTFLRTITISIQKEMLKEYLAYSIPSAPHYLLGWSTVWVNKIMLNNLRSTAAVGVYDVGVYIGGITDVIRAAINQAYLPWFFKEMKAVKSNTKKVEQFIEYTSLLYCFSALCIALFSKEIVGIVTSDQYFEAWRVVPFITFSYVFYGYYYFFVSNLLYDKKHTKYIAVSVFISAMINALANILLIPKFGMVGSSLATLLAMGTTSILVLLITNRFLVFVFPWKKMYAFFMLFFLCSLFIFIEDLFADALSFLIRTGIVLLTAGIVYLKYKNDVLLFVVFLYQFVRTLKYSLHTK